MAFTELAVADLALAHVAGVYGIPEPECAPAIRRSGIARLRDRIDNALLKMPLFM